MYLREVLKAMSSILAACPPIIYSPCILQTGSQYSNTVKVSRKKHMYHLGCLNLP